MVNEFAASAYLSTRKMRLMRIAAQVVWIADLLPDEAAPKIAAMIEEGMSAMQKALGS
jgi:hypothetical protein